MTNIILIGLRGSGKTSIGKKIAKSMKRQFIDTDREIEKQTQKSIAKLIKVKGWNYFRKIEKYIVRRVSKLKNVIISTGGGTIIDTENRTHLKRNGYFVYLKLPVEQIVQRLKDDETRPALTDNSNLLDEMFTVLKDREKTYIDLADLTFTLNADTDDFKKDLKLNTSQLNQLLQSANDEFKKPS